MLIFPFLTSLFEFLCIYICVCVCVRVREYFLLYLISSFSLCLSLSLYLSLNYFYLYFSFSLFFLSFFLFIYLFIFFCDHSFSFLSFLFILSFSFLFFPLFFLFLFIIFFLFFSSSFFFFCSHFLFFLTFFLFFFYFFFSLHLVIQDFIAELLIPRNSRFWSLSSQCKTRNRACNSKRRRVTRKSRATSDSIYAIIASSNEGNLSLPPGFSDLFVANVVFNFSLSCFQLYRVFREIFRPNEALTSSNVGFR